MTDARIPAPSAGRRTRHAAALALVVALAPALGGCAVLSLGRFVGLPVGRAPAPPDAPPRGSAAEARQRGALEPREPYWPFHLAELHAAADSLPQAEAALAEALRRDPAYAPALALFSKLRYETGRHEEAIAVLEAARAAPGGLPAPVLAGLALHYDALGRDERAREIIAATARAAGGDDGAAAVYLALRGPEPGSADAAAERAVERRPKSAVHQNNYGITRLRAGDPDRAERAFRAAVALDPALPGPYYNLAILEKFYRLDDEAAARWFARYRERSHDDPDGLAELFGAGPAAVAKQEP